MVNSKIILSDAKVSEVCFDDEKELTFNLFTCKCGQAVEMENSYEEIGHQIQITNNCIKSKFEIGIDGEKPRYKLIQKKVAWTPQWHVYGGPDLDDRICTIRFVPHMNLKVYFYEQPYPKRSDDTDFEQLHTLIDSQHGLLWQLSGNLRSTGEPCFDIIKRCCSVKAMVSPGVDYILVIAITLVWVTTLEQQNNNNTG